MCLARCFSCLRIIFKFSMHIFFNSFSCLEFEFFCCPLMHCCLLFYLLIMSSIDTCLLPKYLVLKICTSNQHFETGQNLKVPLWDFSSTRAYFKFLYVHILTIPSYLHYEMMVLPDRDGFLPIFLYLSIKYVCLGLYKNSQH